MNESEEPYVPPASSVAFVGAITFRFPILLPILAEHLEDQEGMILPHLFMADVERWMEIEFLNRYERSKQLITSVLGFIEDAMAMGDEHVKNVIHVSFLEHLPRPAIHGDGLRSLVGPRCQDALKQIG